jgi:hypothetical protein
METGTIIPLDTLFSPLVGDELNYYHSKLLEAFENGQQLGPAESTTEDWFNVGHFYAKTEEIATLIDECPLILVKCNKFELPQEFIDKYQEKNNITEIDLCCHNIVNYLHKPDNTFRWFDDLLKVFYYFGKISLTDVLEIPFTIDDLENIIQITNDSPTFYQSDPELHNKNILRVVVEKQHEIL